MHYYERHRFLNGIIEWRNTLDLTKCLLSLSEHFSVSLAASGASRITSLPTSGFEPPDALKAEFAWLLVHLPRLKFLESDILQTVIKSLTDVS